MSKFMLIAASGALIGAALTYFAVGRRVIAGSPGGTDTLTGRARALGDRVKAGFQAATGPHRDPSGRVNTAFEQHRAETLARLEDEQRQFMEFLRNIRNAKDQAEFDAFLAKRNARAEATGAPSAAPAGDAPAGT
jgi:Protein of unknown function (DUF2852)